VAAVDMTDAFRRCIMRRTSACRGLLLCFVPALAAAVAVVADADSPKAPAAARPTTTPAAEIKSRTVSFKLAREDFYITRKRDREVELVRLPPGTITLKGPDGKDHEHAIKPIWMSKFETRWDEYDVFWDGLDLTAEQWQDWRRRNNRQLLDGRSFALSERPRMPDMPPYGNFGDTEHCVAGYPVNCVTFSAAMRYCAWLSKLTGHKFRLPTEAEWEYACRAGGPPVEPGDKALDAIGWYAGNSKDEPHPVGKKRPNAWGLYDMLGNVGEYVVRDPKDDNGLLAGGSYEDDAKDVRSAAREPYSLQKWQGNEPRVIPDTDWLYWTVHHVGIRVVMDE